MSEKNKLPFAKTGVKVSSMIILKQQIKKAS
jgi:hypothetical protein